MYRIGVLVLMVLALDTKTAALQVDAEMDNPQQKNRISPFTLDEEYIRHIHSIINAYRSDVLGGRLVIETNALIDTKYRTWKRNADIINSLLALPKGMDEAGR